MSGRSLGRDTSRHVYATATVRRVARKLGIELQEVTGTSAGGRVSLRDLSKHHGNDARPQEPGVIRPTGFATRRAAALSASQGIDIAGVRGSGPYGMVFSTDVLRTEGDGQAARARAREVSARPTSPPILPPTEGQPQAEGASSREPDRAAPANAASPLGLGIAHVTTVQEIDVTEVSRLPGHALSNEAGSQPHVLVYIASAVARMLEAHPLLHARYGAQTGTVSQPGTVRLGLALGSGGSEVRVVDDAGRLAPADLAAALDVSRTQPEPTFTVSAASDGGLFEMMPLPAGHAATLAIGTPERKAIVVSSGDTVGVAVRLRCYLSLTYDHRLIDRAVANRFLGDVRRAVEASA